MIERINLWEYLGIHPDDEYEHDEECWHEFPDGDLPDKLTDKCLHCGKTAKELNIES